MDADFVTYLISYALSLGYGADRRYNLRSSLPRYFETFRLQKHSPWFLVKEKESVMKTNTPNRSIPLVKPLNLLTTGFFLLLLLFCAASPASAAITFDSSSTSAVAIGARSITWRHTIGSGPDRALVVAVAIDDFIIERKSVVEGEGESACGSV